MDCNVGVLMVVTGLVVLGAAPVAGGMLTGCASAPSTFSNCTVKEVISPATAVADHTAAAPGNQQAFNVVFEAFPAEGCALPLPVTTPQGFVWVSSDPVNAPISNAAATAGVATCVGATVVPATISVSSATNVQVATLTCK
jgi:hypothetical protein